MKMQIITKKVMLFGVLLMLCLAHISFAQDKEEQGVHKIAKVKAVIHETGVIDKVSGDTVIIGDKLFHIAANASKKYAVDGSSYSGSLAKGMQVGIEVNKNREIVTIWVLGQK